MTTPVVTEPTAAAPAEQPAKPETRADRKANSVAALKEMLAAKGAAKAAERNPAPTPAPKAAEEPSATAAKIEAAGGEAPEKNDGESETSYQLRLAKTYRELRATAAKAQKLEQSEKTTRGELAKLQKLLEEGKANPLKMLEHFGMNYADLVKGINEDKFKPSAKNPLPPELQEKIDRLEAADKERRERDAADKRAQSRRHDEGLVAEALKTHADRFPLTAAIPGIEKMIIDFAYTNKQQDVEEILEAYEASAAEQVLPTLASEKALAKVLKAKPELKDLFLKVMGLSKADVVDPKSLNDLGSAPDTPDAKPSREKLKAQAAAMLAERKAAKKK